MDNRELEFSTDIPRKQFFEVENKQNEPPNKNTIGYKSEIRKYPKFKRIHDLNKRLSSTEYRELNFFYQTSQILGQLQLSIKLRPQILKKVEMFYPSLVKQSNNRIPSVLCSVCVYLTCLERFIFTKRIDFYTYCSKLHFDNCLKEILRDNRALRLKFHSDEFRLKTIRTQLNGLKNHFYLSERFFLKTCENLTKYFKSVRNSKNVVISAIVFDLTRKELVGNFLKMSEVCYFLGISASNLYLRCLKIERE